MSEGHAKDDSKFYSFLELVGDVGQYWKFCLKRVDNEIWRLISKRVMKHLSCTSFIYQFWIQSLEKFRNNDSK